MKVIFTIAVLCAAILSSADLVHGRQDTPRAPNVVIVSIDALTTSHLPFHGYAKDTAPFLRGLSERGVIFKNAFSTCSWTAPSVASLLTSLYPFQHGLVRRIDPKNIKKEEWSARLNKLPQEVTTLAEVMRDSGFRTYAAVSNPHICKELNFDQGFTEFRSYDSNSANVINSKLKEWEMSIKEKAPYFLFIHYLDPHSPHIGRDPWYEKQEDEMANSIAAYDSEIRFVDEKIKEMFDLFGWGENTLLIVTSDHGEEFGGHGVWGHGYTLYSKVIHVPLLIYFPDGGVKSETVEDNISLIDIVPTVRELAGLPPGEHDEGISLVPYLKQKETDLEPRRIFSYLTRKKYEYKTDLVVKSVIYGDWHYIVSSPGSEEIYNLKDDPEERFNRIDDSKAIADQLKAELSGFEKNCKKYEQAVAETGLEKEKIEELKALGYLQ
ncbi:sulfatase [Candidatus Omnitrophota bacterium]